jgi:Oxidoreductase family, NAD-binding Rossmann fold
LVAQIARASNATAAAGRLDRRLHFAACHEKRHRCHKNGKTWVEERIRYGLVGTGMMGVEHIQNLALLPGAVVTALADPVDTSLGWARAALKDRAEGVQAFENSAALAASGLVDAVIVASPNHTHRDVLAPLFDAGLNILCEKPLATTIEDARWIVDRAEKSPGIFWTAMEYRYMPPAAAVSGCFRSANTAFPFFPRSVTGTVSPTIPAERWSRNAATSSI